MTDLSGAVLAAFLSRHADCVAVTVTEAKGSTPREAGALMVVARHQVLGTIGGGQLEYLAIEKARAMLEASEDQAEMAVPLGPAIGQCCGGWVKLTLSLLTPQRRQELLTLAQQAWQAFPQVFIFGAGHVGLALAAALAPLPFRTRLIDARDAIDGAVPTGIPLDRTAMPESHVAQIAPGGGVVIVTHDHALDFLIAREALARDDLSYIGMIGSATKRASFAHWLEREGDNPAILDRLILPIGASPIRDKRPPVIAALVAAELVNRLL
ncbi:xanthine dehydrogenase accessory protein XdhC [Agrobacterium vitis]|uniref:xanthine dehydrogenase accessory protein XdhC n=1 Tax=Agrobacterium vitis TaxID=373 RepID=UPI0013264D97|nr:xanthine dehydrogenase accessory protein XdhC [Agrobacterium vitis]